MKTLAPPHPERRVRPLPGHRPKPAEEDPDAPRRVAAIMNDPSCRAADRDVDFLQHDHARGPRLELDHLKTEPRLEEHGIGHTIVVSGRTRITELAAAQPMRPDRNPTRRTSFDGVEMPSMRGPRSTRCFG
jgi:hypothetical protein